MTDLINFINNSGFQLTTTIKFGGVTRLGKDSNSKKKNGWMIAFENTKTNGEKFIYAKITDWSTGEIFEYKPDGLVLSAKESNDLKKKIKEQQEKSNMEKLTKQNKAKQMAAYIMENKSCDLGHGYLTKKKIDHDDSTFICKDGLFCIPMLDKNGQLFGLQRIDVDGNKKFLSGQKTKGTFHTIKGNKNKVFICEGYATGYSIHQATGETVLCSFSVSLLEDTYKDALEIYPESKIIIAADNDQFTKGNPGLTEAQKIKAKHGVEYVYPTFDNLESKPTDFNDLFLLNGIESVKKQTSVEIKDESDFITKDESKYEMYKKVFEKIYPSASRCCLSGLVYYKQVIVTEINGVKSSRTKLKTIENTIKSLKSNVSCYGIPTTPAIEHFHKWLQDMPAKLLVNLKDWDGVDRIDIICKHIKSSVFTSDEITMLFKGWFSTAIKRAFNPTVQNHCMILYGGQGIGKSTLVESFLSHFDIYFSSIFLDQPAKDVYQSLEGSIFAYIDEQDDMHGMKLSFLKTLISGARSKYRGSYKESADFVDQTWSFISSSNFDDMLKDPSGNRRFLIIPIDAIDFGYMKHVDKAQLASQMYDLYENNFSISSELQNKIVQVRANFEPDDKTQDIVDAIAHKIGSSYGLTRYSTEKYDKFSKHTDDINKILRSFKGVRWNAISKRMRDLGYMIIDKNRNRFVNVSACQRYVDQVDKVEANISTVSEKGVNHVVN